MKLESHYLRLHNRFNGTKRGEPLAVTVDEVADALDCTHRNAVLLLKRMTACGWLSWSPKRGRGNRSELRLLADAEAIILRMAQSLVEMRDLRGALEQLQVPAIPVVVRERFHEWLAGYFGFQSVRQGGTRIDTLRFPLNGPLHSLDPLHMNYTLEAHLASQLFDSLVRRHPGTDTVRPHVAHAWETDVTRTRWTFYLRKGVLFHHGRELTAEDVRFTLDRLRSASRPIMYRWALERIESVRVIDPYTVQIALSEPNELFLQFLCTYRTSIVPEDAVRASGERFGRQPVGTGPFRLTSYDGTLLTLEAHPAYFKGRAHLDRVEIWNMPDLNRDGASANLQQFQIIHNARLPQELSQRWSKARPVGMTCKFITFHTGKGRPLADEVVRRRVFDALKAFRWAEAFDSADIAPAAGFTGSLSGPSAGIAAGTAMPMRKDDDDDPPSGFRVACVSKEASCHFSDGPAAALELCTITHYAEDARMAQEACAAAGIDLRITLLSPEEFKTDRRLNADLLLFALPLDEERELRMIDLFCSMIRHLAAEVAAATERMISAIVREPAYEGRNRLFHELERQFIRDRSLLFLYKKRLTAAYHPSVQGIPLDELGWLPFQDIWFKPMEGDSGEN